MQIGRAGVSTSVSFQEPCGECVVRGNGRERPQVGLLAGFRTEYAVDFHAEKPGVSTLHGVPVTQTTGLGKDCLIRDNETQTEWSVFPHDGCDTAGVYRPGSASFVTTHNKVECELTFTAVHDAQAEIWMVRLRNLSAQGRSLGLTAYVEPCIGVPLEMAYSPAERTILMRQPLTGGTKHLALRQTQNLVLFMSCTLPVSSVALSKSEETGAGSSQLVAEAPAAQFISTVTSEPTGRLSVELELPVEGEAEFAFCVGATDSPEAALAAANALSGVGVAAEHNRKIIEQWQTVCKGFSVESPDGVLDALVNTWLPYQTYTASMHDSGHSARLSPWSAADDIRRLFGTATMVPEALKEALVDFAPRVAPGNTYSPDGRSIIVSPPEEMIWLVCGVLNYISETGDTRFLDLPVGPSVDGTSTMRELCDRAVGLFTERLESSACGYPGTVVDTWVRAWGEFASDSSLVEKYIRVAQGLIELAAQSFDEPLECEQAIALRTFCPSFWEPEVLAAIKEALGSQPEQLSPTSAYCLINTTICEQILGIRAAVNGLIVNPRMPQSWTECRVRRIVRQETYEFNIARAPGLGKSRIALVDGAQWDQSSNFLPYFSDGRTHSVTVHTK